MRYAWNRENSVLMTVLELIVRPSQYLGTRAALVISLVFALRKIELDDWREVLYQSFTHWDRYRLSFLHVCNCEMRSRKILRFALKRISAERLRRKRSVQSPCIFRKGNKVICVQGRNVLMRITKSEVVMMCHNSEYPLASAGFTN